MIPFVGICSGIGGSHSGSKEGPLVIQQALGFDWHTLIYPESEISNQWDHIALMNQKLAYCTYKCALEAPFFVVLGGDHSCAVGTWSGIAEAQRKEGKDLALLWLDAHMDSHTPETSETGNIHGMPLASLLGYGSPKLTDILSDHAKLKPENVFLIGIRSFEEPEKRLLEKLNVRVYYIEEVMKRGLEEIFSEIVTHLQARQIPYGISLDIDFFDPEVMPATGTPEENGICPEQFMQHYSLFDAYPPIALEFVEFNPPCDIQGKSLEKVVDILDGVFQIYQQLERE